MHAELAFHLLFIFDRRCSGFGNRPFELNGALAFHPVLRRRMNMPDTRSLAKTRLQIESIRPDQSSPQPAERLGNTRREANSPTRSVASGSASVVGNESADSTRSLADTAEYLVEATDAETRLLKVRVHNLKALRVS